jgi:hypothetical protein
MHSFINTAGSGEILLNRFVNDREAVACPEIEIPDIYRNFKDKEHLLKLGRSRIQ